MYTYPESITVVARYLLPELGESACCLHCRQKLHIVNPVAIHRLCGIVLCESCFSNALIDYHSSPLVGCVPPCCPSCHHSLTEENLNLALPPLRYAIEDPLSQLNSQRWRQELQSQQLQELQQAQSFSNSYGFGHVYEPILFGGKNSVGEEFMVLPDGTAVRANPRPVHYVQLEQQVQNISNDVGKIFATLDEINRRTDDRNSSMADGGGNNAMPPWYQDKSGQLNPGKDNWQTKGNRSKAKWAGKRSDGNNKNRRQNHNQKQWWRR
jgi:hypothetical protein